ncbi:hypothetical protein [Rhodovulum steppense]|uniref:Uncharacterized protein n=1 Tax=Rhodovulum steppense TaxID=540251 RepID=A0A4R1YJH0_9RHOB|nr:hypothetical protein [Rhodovulum steppense]TCM76787.1 hypothetical protein EV216_13226 [Rhodovulum steppense]
MASTNILNPNPPEFERFLYAYVGEDRRGSAVTVLSALARLNLDPWAEAAELAALGREGAATRFGLLLARVRDVPALGQDHGPVGRDLTRLLPEGAARPGSTGAAAKIGFPISSGAFWAILAAFLVLAQIMFGGSSGMGE